MGNPANRNTACFPSLTREMVGGSLGGDSSLLKNDVLSKYRLEHAALLHGDHLPRLALSSFLQQEVLTQTSDKLIVICGAFQQTIPKGYGVWWCIKVA